MNVYLKTGVIDSLDLDQNELRTRLCCPLERIENLSDMCKRVKEQLRPKYVYTFSDIKSEEGKLNLGFGQIESRDLEKNLNGCDSACLLAVTLGSDIDRYLIKLSKIDPVDSFFADAIASAFAESLIDEAEKLVLGDMPHKARYSIGYGDLPLFHQKGFLDLLSAEKTVGITLTERLLMTPSKSITAIIGMKK